jgi:hypothetical protein
MAIYNKTIKNSNGITYTKEVDGPSDWYGIQNNTYFKDLSDDLIYWKDNAGIVIAIYERNLCTTGSTLIGSIVYFDRNDSLSAYTLDLSSLDVNDTFITGMTFNPSTYEIIATRNDGFSTSPIDLSILSADVNVTGGTYDINTGVVTFTNNSGGTFNVSGFTSGMTDSYTTAASLSGNSITFDNNITGPNFYNVDLTPILSGITLTSGNGITIGTGNTIDLGGTLTQPITIISGSSTELLDIGANFPGVHLGQVRINATSYQGNHLTAYDGTGAGTLININPAEFSSTNYINPVSRTQIINGSSNSSLYFTSNKIFRLYLDSSGAGIAPGSGESFTINGTTFTEGIDFTGQGNYLLDAASIAGLNYTGISNFVSVTDEGSGFVKFIFSNPVQVSETLTDGNFLVFNWESSVQTDDTGVTIKVGDDDFYGTPGTILAIGDSETIFTDNSAIPKGIQYGANYDATLVDDSLTTKRYVDNAITAATDNNYYTTGSTLINDIIYFDRNDTLSAYTADLTSLVSGLTLTGGNGITIGTGNTINLGGLLTQSTTISGNSVDLDIGVTGSELSFLNIRSLQAQEQYKFAGEGLVVTKNPGQFMTELDYTATLGEKTTSQQTPINISTTVISNSGNTTSQIVQTPGVINLLTNTDESTLSDSGLILDQSADSFRFVDNRLAHRGLEYDADYSSGYTSLSLITKGDLDNAITAITDNNYYTTGTTLIGNTIYFDRNDTLSAYTADLTSLVSGATFSGGSGNCISDLYVTNVHGCSPITIKDELIIESGITGTGNIDITGNVISDIVQLRGGVGTQGEMSWSTDEETVQLIMDGTTLHIGQDTFVHARNNTASIITKGTAVYATGTLGASGRITVAPMIANGTIAGRLFIGLAAENIAIGADGQVMTFGKIRGINTNTYTDGDVLWLSPTVAGQLTTTEPTAPNLKIATAFVIHAATNGTLMVRAEQGTDLHTDQRVQVSGLTDGDVLTWNGTNNRWQNEQPIADVITKTSGVFNRTLTLQAPTSSDDITIFRTDVAITVQEVIAVSVGTTPSTTYQLKHSTDRDAAGSNLTTSAATTSKTTGNVATLSVAAIPANSWVWLETTAASGTNVILTVDIRYTID